MKKRDFDTALAKIADVMKHKIDANSHKQDWKEQDIAELILLLGCEYQEMRYAYSELVYKEDNESKENLIKELADVANYCMFIVDKLIQQN